MTEGSNIYTVVIVLGASPGNRVEIVKEGYKEALRDLLDEVAKIIEDKTSEGAILNSIRIYNLENQEAKREYCELYPEAPSCN